MVTFSDAVPPLAVSYCPVTRLRPDARNARAHPKQQIDQIVASIRQFGFVNPILADPDGSVIAGHGRLLAAKAMGLCEVPTIALAGLSETQKRALRIADNKIALGAGWDLDLLKGRRGLLRANLSAPSGSQISSLQQFTDSCILDMKSTNIRLIADQVSCTGTLAFQNGFLGASHWMR